MKRTNMKRKALAVVLTLAMVMTFVPTMAFAAETDTAAPKTTMTDVTGHWAEKAITKWADYGVLKGDDRGFRPQDSITRAEVATVIDNMMDFQVAAKNTFSDVSANAWYADAVLKANAAGVLSGADGKAMPADKITREQAAVMLARSFAVEANKGASTKFADAAQISAWAKELVYGMEAAGFVNGNNGNFNPKSFITRAELVTMIDNAVKNYHNVAGTCSDDVAGLTIVSAPNVILKGETLAGDLIVAEGVANGDFTLDNVKVQGDLIVRGGGENSVKVTGGSTVSGTVVLEKVGDKVRITTTNNNGVALGTVEVASGNVVLDGKFGKVSIVGNVEVSVAKGTTVDSLTVAKDAAGTKVAVAEGATVTTLTMDAKTTVDNKGTITTAKANVSGIVLGGTAPKTTEVPKGVDAPKNEKGEVIGGTKEPSSPGSPGGSRDTTVGTLTYGETVTIGGILATKDANNENRWKLFKGYDKNTTLEASAAGSGFVETQNYPMYVSVIVNGTEKIKFSQSVLGKELNKARKITNNADGSNNVEGDLDSSLSILLDQAWDLWASSGKTAGDKVDVAIGTTVNGRDQEVTRLKFVVTDSI